MPAELSPNRGSIDSMGTYTFDGKRLSLTYTYIDYEDDMEPFTLEYDIRITDGKTSFSYYTLYKGDDMNDVARRVAADSDF